MSLSSQPLSSEEPEQQLTLPSIEETPTEDPPTELSSATSDPLPEKTEEQPIPAASEEMPTESEAPSELNKDIASIPNENSTSTSSENEEVAIEGEEDEEDEEDEEQKGVFIQRSWLIGAACVVVAAALLATFLLLINHPQDPPTDWIASYIPPAGSSSATKILYYLHWTNQNSNLKGQLQLAANANGTPQSLTVPVVGLYNKENHVVYVIITVNGQPDTLTGTINEKNDTLILNQAGSTSPDSQLTFHTGSSSDYQQATKKLGPTKK